MDLEINQLLLWGGLFIGLSLGAVIQRTNFCMAAAVSNMVLMKDSRQLHAYLAAVAIAIIGTQFLSSAELIEVNEAAYLSPQINLLGAIIGGAVFGIGTVLAGGCVGRTLVRVGEGNIGSIIVLIAIAIMAAITMYGPLELFRVEIMQSATIDVESKNSSLSSILGIDSLLLSLLLVTLCLSLISLIGIRTQDKTLLFAGVIIGLLVVAGWYVTGYLSRDMFSIHRPSSLAFAGPLANSAYIISSGNTLGEAANFGLALLFGTVLGSLASALVSRSFHWKLPEYHHIKHLIIGGMLMGFGAVVAGGCNIGHGLSGISTCSITSVIALVSIVSGMRLGLYFLMSTELSSNERKLRMFIGRLLHH